MRKRDYTADGVKWTLKVRVSGSNIRFSFHSRPSANFYYCCSAATGVASAAAAAWRRMLQPRSEMLHQWYCTMGSLCVPSLKHIPHLHHHDPCPPPPFTAAKIPPPPHQRARDRLLLRRQHPTSTQSDNLIHGLNKILTRSISKGPQRKHLFGQVLAGGGNDPVARPKLRAIRCT
jgi:hypothetical protein